MAETGIGHPPLIAKPPFDLDAFDESLLAELAQQVKDGVTTQAEADRLADIIRRTCGGGK